MPVPIYITPQDMNFQQLLFAAAQVLQNDWQKVAIDAGLSPAPGHYVSQILIGDYFEEFDGGSIKIGAYAPHSQWVESGHNAFDLGEHIDASKWRMSKKPSKENPSGLYIRIPFGHGAPGGERNAMPRAVYAKAKKLEGKARLSAEQVDFGVGGLSRRSKLFAGYGEGQAWTKLLKKTWTASPYQAMFKSVSQPTQSGQQHSKYMTIRTVTPENRWMIPAQAGRFFRQQVITNSEPKVKELFQKSIAIELTIGFGQQIKAIFTQP